MKHGFVSGLGFRPSGGAGEAGLPANSGDSNNRYCFDRFRQRVWAGGTDYHIGKVMPLGPEVKALQLRPDGLRGAREVRLVFRPHERHVKAYGETSILSRAGEIVPVPWCKDELQANAAVEVYPCFQATVNIPSADVGHYARFALIEDDIDKKDASGWLAPDTAHFWQTESLALVANAYNTDKTVPGLEVVPCAGMRSAVLKIPCAPDTTAANSQLLNDMYWLSVFAVDPGLGAILPLCAGHPEGMQGGSLLRHFNIPEGTRALLVSAWRYQTAHTIDPTTDYGGVELFLSSADVRLPLNQRSSGKIVNCTSAQYEYICSMVNPAEHARVARVRCQLTNLDAADAFNASLYLTCNIGNEARYQKANSVAVSLGAVAASTTTVTSSDYTWDAAILYGIAAANVVDSVESAMMVSYP